MSSEEFERKDVEQILASNRSLQKALQIALSRLEKGGLPFQDLILPLLQNPSLLHSEETNDAASIGGPYVYGILSEAGDMAGPIRFVFECSSDQIEALQLFRGDIWICAQATEIEYFRNWLITDNEDMIDHPHHWGVEKSDSPPSWIASK